MFAGRLADGANVADVSRAASAAAPRADSPRPSDLLLDGLARLITEGRAAAAPALERAVGAFAGDGISAEAAFRWGWLAVVPALVLWDLDGWLAISDRGVQPARDAGGLAVLPIVLTSRCVCASMVGDFATATSLIAEADAIAEATETRFAPYAALVRGHG